MGSEAKYDFDLLIAEREEGLSWREIRDRHYPSSSTEQCRNALAHYRKRCRDRGDPDPVDGTVGGDRAGRDSAGEPPADQHQGPTVERTFTVEDISRITSLEDLLEFFEVDTDRWAVRDYRVNKWEQHSVKKGLVPLYQVRANLVRNLEVDAEVARETYQQVLDDMWSHAPAYEPVVDVDTRFADALGPSGPPCLAVLAIQDAHLGMLAWNDEVGESYDLQIAAKDYRAAAEHLLATVRHHNVERVLFLVGNDLIHIDHLDQGKVGVTASGTPQDYDSRLARIFTTARRVTVDVIDHGRLLAPTDVVVVPGNHDLHSMYKLGEVLGAWYRRDERVNVINDPTLRHYYRYGANLLGLTHGLEFKRKREPLPLIMATEAPEDWAATTHREWLTGHFHSAQELEYMAPRSNLIETRGVRVRSLPGLTAVDAWHSEHGYLHQRAATALVYAKEGGLVGLYEHHPHIKEMDNA